MTYTKFGPYSAYKKSKSVSYEMTGASSHSYGPPPAGVYAGHRGIDRSKPMRFKECAYTGLYPGYASRYSDAPPVHKMQDMLNLSRANSIPDEQICDLTQWVFEVAGDFMLKGEITQGQTNSIRNALRDIAWLFSKHTDPIIRMMRRDKGVMPLEIIAGWWKESDMPAAKQGWIVKPPVAREERVLNPDNDWPHSRQDSGLIFDVGLPGNLYIGYSMRRDAEGHHNIFALPVHMMAEYLSETVLEEHKVNLRYLMNIIASFESEMVITKKSEMAAAMAAMKDREQEKKSANTPTQTATAKYEIGMFG